MELKHTSRVENLVLGPDSASLALEGRPIRIKGHCHETAQKAFQALYDSALAEYEARHAPQTQGLLAWLGRLWRKSPAGSSARSLPTPPTAPAAYVPHAAYGGSMTPASSESRSVATPGRPSLQSIFADHDGIHLTWRYAQSDGRGAKLTQTVEATFGLESETARRLESCYGALAKLGYEVKTIADLAAPSAAGTARPPLPDPPPENPATAAAAPSAGPVPSPTPAPKPPPEASPPPPSPPPALVFRLHLKSADSSARMLVVPVEDSDRPQVLVAPERLIRALQVGSAESRPANERVTFVRCVNGEKGLKVVEIGLGVGGDRAPARWDDAALWWEGTGKNLAKPPPIPGTVPGPGFAAGSSPLQTGLPAEPSVG